MEGHGHFGGGGGEQDYDVRQLLLDPRVRVGSRRGHVPAVEAPAGLQWAGRHRRPSSLSGVIVVFRRSHLQILPDEGDGEVRRERRRVRLCGVAVRRERTRTGAPPGECILLQILSWDTPMSTDGGAIDDDARGGGTTTTTTTTTMIRGAHSVFGGL